MLSYRTDRFTPPQRLVRCLSRHRECPATTTVRVAHDSTFGVVDDLRPRNSDPLGRSRGDSEPERISDPRHGFFVEVN